MRIPFGFHIVDSAGKFVSDADLTPADIQALLAQIDGEDDSDEDEEI